MSLTNVYLIKKYNHDDDDDRSCFELRLQFSQKVYHCLTNSFVDDLKILPFLSMTMSILFSAPLNPCIMITLFLFGFQPLLYNDHLFLKSILTLLLG